MTFLINVWTVLPGWDWAAMAVFGLVWAGYVQFAARRALTRPSILASTNRIRHQWMLQTTYRDVRVLDGAVCKTTSPPVPRFLRPPPS